MELFFVQDYRQKYRLFSLRSLQPGEVRFSRWKALWGKAKEKLLLLPPRVLYQEQALAQMSKTEAVQITILISGRIPQDKLERKFHFFLQKQKTIHLIYLIGEIFLLPLSGLAALLPGPNVFFGFLALLLDTHWRAWRGIKAFQGKQPVFKAHPLLCEWEEAIQRRDTQAYPRILQQLSQAFDFPQISRILWK
jgi:hypothetical protein